MDLVFLESANVGSDHLDLLVGRSVGVPWSEGVDCLSNTVYVVDQEGLALPKLVYVRFDISDLLTSGSVCGLGTVSTVNWWTPVVAAMLVVVMVDLGRNGATLLLLQRACRRGSSGGVVHSEGLVVGFGTENGIVPTTSSTFLRRRGGGLGPFGPSFLSFFSIGIAVHLDCKKRGVNWKG